MLRDKNLVPLSRQHQHALALCVRLDRALQAGEVDLAAWQAEIEQTFAQEIQIHFVAEEKEVFPLAAEYEELKPLVTELKTEHSMLRSLFSRAAERSLEQTELRTFLETLSHHIRKEERQLFEQMQELIDAQQLAKMGAALDIALKDAIVACSLPTPPNRP
jgi:hemerythrin-like domain-containing protein